jgi:N-methylhydantoinase B
VDPIKLTVLCNRLESIASEMQDILVRTAYSAVVKEARDCSTAIFDIAGQTIAQAPGTIPILLGVMMESVPYILKTYPIDEMHEGDVFILNHPYMGGTHLPDVTGASPIFYDGQPVALSCAMVHHADLGGMAPGSFPLHATELHQEGLLIPPIRLLAGWREVPETVSLLRANSRVPDVIMGDFRAQCAAIRIGVNRVSDLFGVEGAETMRAVMSESLDYGEALCREAIASIPDGVYEFVDYSDNDGVEVTRPIRFEVSVKISGSSMIIDFGGSSAQAVGPINSTPANARAVASYVVRTISGMSMPTNAGVFRPIELVLPKGSIVNPDFPAPVCNRGVTYHRIHDVIMGALVGAVPHRVTAAHNGCPVTMSIGGRLGEQDWVLGLIVQGGMGARWNQDGIDAITTEVSNISNQPVEAIESEFPLRVIKRALIQDSGGAGEFRGGLGQEVEVELLAGHASCSYLTERHVFAPWGLAGGGPAIRSSLTIHRAGGGTEEITGQKVFRLDANDRFVLCRPGGGGYGDPYDRPAEAVASDVEDGRISEAAAKVAYGVVLNGQTVDLPATEELRERCRTERGAVTWVFDRGPHGRDNGLPRPLQAAGDTE